MSKSVCIIGLLLFSAAAAAEQYVISTYAGGAPLPTPAPGVSLSIGAASVVAVDGADNVYFASAAVHAVFRLDSRGIVTRVAGNSRPSYSGDGGPAASAQLWEPTGIAVDSIGNLFIADSFNNRVRKVSPDGIITTVAGNGGNGFSGDGGPATEARFNRPGGVAVDRAGNLFIGDALNGRIRKVSSDGAITTVAGNGTQGFSGDGGPATSAQLLLGGCCAVGVAVDDAGALLIADNGNNRIRKVSPDGIITTVAGAGAFGSSGDGGLATSALLSFPLGVAVDGSGNLFLADYSGIRKVSTGGIITKIAGNGACCGVSAEEGPAAGASMSAIGVAVDRAGNVFIADKANQRIRKISRNGIITTVAGTGQNLSGDGGPAANARLSIPVGVAVDATGNLFVMESFSSRVRKISASGIITTVAGGGVNGLGDGGPATSATLSLWGCNSLCGSVAVDKDGNLFIADPGHGRIRKVSPDGIITTAAGGGSGGDGEQAASAELISPYGVAVDREGNMFIAESYDGDAGASRVRKVSADGIITTVAGGGETLGDSGPATSAHLGLWTSVAVDRAGNLFIADPDNRRVRKVSKEGIITTVAGTGTWGFSGDGGPATSARMALWNGIAVDDAGNLFIADGFNLRIRKVSPDGIITTIAGNGVYGFYAEGASATSAQLGFLPGVAVDGAGNVYATDWYNNVVHVLRPAK